MAFGIQMIKKILSDNGMPLENLEAAASEICGRHKTDMDSVKEERDGYKTTAEKAADLENQLQEANDKITAYESEDYKTKYETANTELENLRAEVAGKETHRKKETAASAALKESKFSAEAVNLILRKGGYIDKLTLDDNGNLSNRDDFLKWVNEDFSMLIPKETEVNAVAENPPANAGNNAFEKMSLGEKMKYANSNPTDAAVVAWMKK